MKWLFLRAHKICLFGLFYYFVTLLYNREEREGIIKETKSLFVRARANSHCLLKNLTYRPGHCLVTVINKGIVNPFFETLSNPRVIK